MLGGEDFSGYEVNSALAERSVLITRRDWIMEEPLSGGNVRSGGFYLGGQGYRQHCHNCIKEVLSDFHDFCAAALLFILPGLNFTILKWNFKFFFNYLPKKKNGAN